MRAGRLRAKMTVQAATESKDARGSVSQSWGTVGYAWADIAPQSGTEQTSAAQREGSLTSVVRMRYYSGLTPKHRLLYGSRTFDILSVADPDGRRRDMDVTVIERNL